MKLISYYKESVMAKKKKKKGDDGKKKNPRPAHDPNKDHRAYVSRERHPRKVLRRIIKSSGFVAAQEYALKYGLERELRRLRKAEPTEQPRLVGRALRRHMKKLSLLALAKKAQASQSQPSMQQK